MLNTDKLLIKVILFLFICGTASGQFSQHRGFNRMQMAPGFFEAHIIPSADTNIAFYIYRIPFNRFVFIKDGGKYKAAFRINIEVTDSTDRHVTRQVDENSFEADSYEETGSEDNYYEGLCSFKIGSGNYKLKPEISDLNSTKEFRLPEINLEYDKIVNRDFLTPLIVFQKQVKCGSLLVYKMANFNKSVPFDDDNYALIIPSLDTTLNKINVMLINNRDTVFKNTVTEYFDAGLMPVECDGNIILKDTAKVRVTRNFVLQNFSGSLDEGALRVMAAIDTTFKGAFKFNTDVKWFNKPLSLMEPEQAIKLLKYIEKPSVIDSLLNFKRENYEKELKLYWKKYDESSKTKFNPLMDEYYSRIDYAMKNYSALSQKNGAETDRGKTFIKYGMPSKIERTSDSNGKMVEKWIYSKAGLSFEFIDEFGAGNYSLKK